MNREEIRKSILKKRKEYPKELVRKNSLIICEKILSLSEYEKAGSIMLYMSHGGEVLTDGIISRAIRAGKKLFAPRVREGEYMDAVALGDSFTKGAFGILEPSGGYIANPAEIDLVLVPGLAFDQECWRIGFGKGYYDRFLIQTAAPKIGLAFDYQIVPTVFPMGHDVPMDKVVTESKTYFSYKNGEKV